MEPFNSQLGEELRNVRKLMRLNQDKFGKVVGTCQRYVQDWEKGRRRPSALIITQLEAWQATEKAFFSLDHLKELLAKPIPVDPERKSSARVVKAMDALNALLAELHELESLGKPVKWKADKLWELVLKTDVKITLSGRPIPAGVSIRWSSFVEQVTAMMLRVDDAEERALKKRGEKES